MRNHATDHDLFIANTKKLRILTGGDKFNQYHRFLLSAIELLKKEKNFPVEAGEWIDTARACLDRKISLEDVRKTQEKIKDYKIKLQKSGDSLEGEGSEEFVIAELLQFAVEHPDDEHRVDTRGTDTSNGTGLVQAIDEFSLLFIEYFGRGSDLVRLLKESFE